MKAPKIEVNFEKRKELEEVLGADQVSYCYQCGACVGDCPSARFYEGFNPREIMLKSLIGDYDDLIATDSIIWKCSNCYNCYERCPQDVRPVEVIIALKNVASQNETSPKEILEVAKRIRETGYSVPIVSSTNRIREELDLPPVRKIDVSELKEILKPDKEADKK
jgi:heterodisulfide reductase subunit C